MSETAAGFHLTRDERGVARLTLARPEKRNAFNDRLIAGLLAALDDLHEDGNLRALVLAAEGKAFSAGADIGWMRAMGQKSEGENLTDARQLARLLARLDALPVPSLALINGPTMGGGVGLISCCDVVLAHPAAVFALSEVRLGIIPSVIHPYLLRGLGLRTLRRYSLTGERFDAQEALRIGLVHELAEDLEERGKTVISAILAGGPLAQAEAKAQLRWLEGRELGAREIEDSAQRIARLRLGPEGQEGLSAFLDKRPAAWVEDR